MDRKTLILGAVAALVIVGGVFAYQYFGGGPNPSVRDTACAHETCGWSGSVRIKLGDPYPPVCPQCNQASVLPLSTCKKCGNKQILNENLKAWISGKDKLPTKTACNKCGGPIVHGD